MVISDPATRNMQYSEPPDATTAVWLGFPIAFARC
jgi:hypothetical protein